MDTNTQQVIIITLGILGLGSILTGNTTIIDIIVAGLLGFLSSKTLTEKQQEQLKEVDDVQ